MSVIPTGVYINGKPQRTKDNVYKAAEVRCSDCGEVVADDVINGLFRGVRKSTSEADGEPLPQLIVYISIVKAIDQHNPRRPLTIQVAVEVVAQRVDPESPRFFG